MEKTNIRMRKYQPQDIYFLFENSNHFNLPQIVAINCDSDFRKELEYSLRTYIHDFFIFEESDKKNPIGFIYSYDFRLYDAHSRFNYYLQVKDSEDKLIEEFIEGMFCEYAVNKLFIYLSESQIKKQNAIKQLGFCREAILKEYKFESGKYVDVFVYGYEKKDIMGDYYG